MSDPLFKGHITKGKIADKWIWLRGPKGAVALRLIKSTSEYAPWYGMVHWHSPVPRSATEGQQERCQFLGDQPCYFGGSFTRGDSMINHYIQGYMMRVWFDLKAYYEEIFDKEH